VAREAAEVTTEGMLDWSTMHPRRDEYDFRSFDALIQFAATHNQTVHGHALVSPDDLPSWLDAVARRRELRDILTAHITTLVHRHRGQIAAWTVVDRPLSDTGGRRRSLWQVRLGPSYVRNAFRAAASADPNAKLYLADYDIVGENPNKTTRFYRLVRELRDSGVPVHGVKVQLRPAVRIGPDGVPFASWSPDTVRRHLGRLRDLGLDIAITVEVRLPEHAGSDVLEVQARTYAEATRIAQQVTAVRSMTIWGASDGLSSVSELFPGTTAATPFTSDLAPKPAYHALRRVLLDSAPVPRPHPGGAPSAVRQALATTPAVAPQSTAAEPVTIEELTLGGRDLSAALATRGRIAAPPIATARPIELFGLPDLQQIDIETGTDTAEFYQLVVALREASIARNRTVALVERADGRRYVVTLGRHGGYLNPAAPDSPAWQYLLEAYRELGESIGSPPPFIRVLVHSEAHRPERTQPALADQELLRQAPGQASAVLVRREGAPIRYRVATKDAPLDARNLRAGSRLPRRVRSQPPRSGPGTGHS
jgi:endo-1,4-beta-xylanase